MTADKDSSAGGFTIGEQHTGWASTVVSCDWACTTEEQAVLREITWQFEHLRNLVGVPLQVRVSKKSSAWEGSTDLGDYGLTGSSPRLAGPDAQPTHKRVFDYDGSFRCLDCGAQWGALPGNPVEPTECVILSAQPTPVYRCEQCGGYFTEPMPEGHMVVRQNARTGEPYPDQCGPVTLDTQPTPRTTLERYNEFMLPGEEPSALERLRFFCALSMGSSGNDWFDVEPFFDELECALAAKEAELRALKHDIARHVQIAADLTNELQTAKETNLNLLHRDFWQICSYCGWESRKEGAQWKELQAHIKTCSYHPLAKAEQRLAAVEAALILARKELINVAGYVEYGAVVKQIDTALAGKKEGA